MGIKCVLQVWTVKKRWYVRSKHTNTVSLSSWVTWIASTCWFAVERKSISEESGSLTSQASIKVPIISTPKVHLHVWLTCSHLCEPGGAGVEVDGLKADHLTRLGAQADGHTHQRILLLRHHQHLKHLQRAGKREVKMLRQEERRHRG